MPEQPDFQLPDDLTTLTPEALAALTADELEQHIQAAIAESAELEGIPGGDMTDEQLLRLEALAEFAVRYNEDVQRREGEAGEREARAEAARQRLAEATTSEPEGDPEGEEPEGDAGDEGSEESSEGDAAPEAQEQPSATPEPQAVAAGAGRAIRRLPARRPTQPVREDREELFSIVAAAGVRDVQAGSRLPDLEAAAEAFINASRAFPGGVATQPGVYQRLSVAKVRRNFAARGDGLYIDNPDYHGSLLDLIREAGDERKHFGDGGLAARVASAAQNRVAAGGWCAPSETLYGFASNETMDGMWDTPTVGMARGGINYTPGPDFQDIYTSAGFAQTEAEAIAGETKACVEVDCPDFSEVRLDAVGICVKAPLLTRAAYNELVTAWIRATVVANAHKVNARRLTAAATALGTALAPTLTGTPVTWGLLTALELVGEGQRQAYRLGQGQTLEVVLPRWTKVALRADLANRNGIDERSVSDAQIMTHFADRGLRVQFVLGWQELSTPTTNVTFPGTVTAMIYPAGTFVTGEKDIIDLDTVYDTADLQTNVYTAAFVEDGVALFKQSHGGKRVTVPVNVNGMLGAAQLDDNWGGAQAESAGA